MSRIIKGKMLFWYRIWMNPSWMSGRQLKGTTVCLLFKRQSLEHWGQHWAMESQEAYQCWWYDNSVPTSIVGKVEMMKDWGRL